MTAKRQRLAQRHKAAGFSQDALAARLDVERSTVARWESGETNPLPWIRPKLGQALGVSADQLHSLLEAMPERLATGHNGTPSAGSPAAASLATATPAENGPPVCQLPPAVADFTGRQPQIAELTGLLSGDRDNQVGIPVAVIVGLPGVGKTALALHVAHKLRPNTPTASCGRRFKTVPGIPATQARFSVSCAGHSACPAPPCRVRPVSGPRCTARSWPGGESWCSPTTPPPQPKSSRCCPAPASARS
jgi:DNA-binding XRE family transcriptional regulator